jgi:zinc protease
MLDRTVAPQSYAVEKFRLPDYRQHSVGTSNIFTVVDHQLPILQLEFIFESGKTWQETPGTSYYAIKMLPEGTISKSANDISFGFESLGSFVEWGSGLDHTFVKVYCQSNRALQSLDLLEEIMTQPSFPAENYGILKKIRSQQIRQQEAKNSQKATAKFNQMLFGSTHPIGHQLTVQEALDVQLEDVRNYYSSNLFNNPSVFITGDSSDAIIRRVEQLLSHLPSSTTATINLIPQPSLKMEVEEKEGTEQVSYRTGMFTLGKQQEKFHQLSIANSMLGGYFGSRLMQKVREELGYTYGIYSTFIHTKNHSYWMIGSELIKAHAAHGAEAIENELTRLASVPPPTTELNKLKSYLKGKLLSSMDSIFSQGAIVKGLVLHNLPDTYYDQYFSAIDDISSEDISRITTEYLLKPDKATYLLG